MSGEGPESIPTSADRRSKRPVKKRALTPVSAQAAGLDALFAKPDQQIKVPVSDALARVRGDGTPEIISNVQGSSSGAGSGEFHVYKASRRREYARLRQLEEEAEQDKSQIEFAKAKEERESRDDEKTRKNREKREKAKARKAKGKRAGAVVPKAEKEDKEETSEAKARPVITRPDDSDDEKDKDKDEDAAPARTNGANGQKPRQEPMPVAEGPGLLIQDDDD